MYDKVQKALPTTQVIAATLVVLLVLWRSAILTSNPWSAIISPQWSGSVSPMPLLTGIMVRLGWLSYQPLLVSGTSACTSPVPSKPLQLAISLHWPLIFPPSLQVKAFLSRKTQILPQRCTAFMLRRQLMLQTSALNVSSQVRGWLASIILSVTLVLCPFQTCSPQDSSMGSPCLAIPLSLTTTTVSATDGGATLSHVFG